MSTATLQVETQEVKQPDGHEEAMIAKLEGAEVPPAEKEPANQDRPEWLPEEFSTVQEMTDAYAALKAKESGVPEEAAPEPMAKFQEEFTASGSLSEESYAELKGMGLSKELVDSYIEGQQLKAQQTEADVLADVGGKEGYSKLVEWAKTNLSADEIAAHNTAVSSSVDTAKVAVAALNKKYAEARGEKPNLITGGKTSTEPRGYESWAQVQEDMRSPKYKKDPAFREAVAGKLKVSQL